MTEPDSLKAQSKKRVMYIPSTMEHAEAHQKAWAKHGVEIRLMEITEDKKEDENFEDWKKELEKKVVDLHLTKKISEFVRDTALGRLRSNDAELIESQESFLQNCIYSHEYSKRLDLLSEITLNLNKKESEEIHNSLVEKGFLNDEGDDKLSMIFKNRTKEDVFKLTDTEFLVYHIIETNILEQMEEED